MNVWVRLWHEMPTDPKWRIVSRKSGRPIHEIIAVFSMMLVNASQSENRGTLENWDDEVVAAALDMDTEYVSAIRDGMQGKVLDGDYLTGWEKRQPKREDDGVTNRVRRYRGNVTQCNAEKRSETQIPIDKDKDKEEKREDTEQKQTQTPPAPDKPKRLTANDLALIPMFSQLAALFGEADLEPTSARIANLRSAMHNVHIGGFPRILEAAQNLARSPAPDGMKRFDWLLHRFDYAEHITEFLTAKNDARPKPRKYAAVPDDWRPDADATATSQ